MTPDLTERAREIADGLQDTQSDCPDLASEADDIATEINNAESCETPADFIACMREAAKLARELAKKCDEAVRRAAALASGGER